MTASDIETERLARADDLIRRGQVRAAIAALEAGAADNAAVQRDLGLALRLDGRHAEAADAFGRAVGLGADHAHELLLARGVILAGILARPEEAEANFRQALALQPDFGPALFNLASLLEERGDRDGARAMFEDATQRDPGNMAALGRLISVSGVAGLDDPLAARVRAAIAAPRTLMADRATLGFALAQALDAVGAHDPAFDAAVAANQASRAGTGGRPARYDRLAHERLIDALIASFPLESDPGVDVQGPAPVVFICGMFRSGSTLVERILGAHPQVIAGGELDLLPSLIRRELAGYPHSVADLDAGELERLRSLYLGGIRSRFPHGRLVTDKRPDNVLHLGLIKRLFPSARIIHTRRNALDNCLSIYFLHLSLTMPYALDLLDTAHWLGQQDRLMVHWRRLLAGDVLDVSYDGLVRSPRETIARLLDFCGLPWDEGCMDFHNAGGVVRTASLWQVREPLYQRSSGRWRNYESRLGPLRQALEGMGISAS